MSKLIAQNDFVFVKTVAKEEASSGGIILTNTEVPCIGEVVSVGPGRYQTNGQREEHNIQVGDVVVFGRSSLNMPHEHEDETFYVMKTGDIFGKLSS